MMTSQLNDLLQRRAEVGALCSELSLARARQDYDAIETAERNLQKIVALQLKFEQGQIPGHPSLADVTFSALLAFPTLERFEHPELALASSLPCVRNYGTTVRGRILELVAQLDLAILKDPLHDR